MSDNAYKYFNSMTELFVILLMFVIVISFICAMGFVRINKSGTQETKQSETFKIEAVAKSIKE